MQTYKIKKGDTLSAIATAFGTSVEALRMANSELIKDVNMLEVGWVIIIPNTSKPANNSDSYYNMLGRMFHRAMKDIKEVPSVKELLALLKD